MREAATTSGAAMSLSLPSNLRLQQDRELPGRTSDEADNSRYSADPALQERLAKMNFSTPGAGTLQQARDYVNGQHAAWGTLVKEIGLQPE